MQSSSPPPAVRQRIVASSHPPRPGINSLAAPSEASSGYATMTGSWTSTLGMSSAGVGHNQQPLAWAGLRHHIMDIVEAEKAIVSGERNTGHCSQAVLITCLHLSHEMALREVGLYGWTLPIPKDAIGSMSRIMKHYAKQLDALSTHPDLNCRLAADPTRLVIQHHLQKARLAAGPDTYVAVLYSGHGIQEPPTEAGELWCYDRSFEECQKDGGGPSEYIPILLFDLLTWAGASSCYVWDCQRAGRFIKAALTEAEEIDTQLRAAAEQNPSVADLHPAVYAKRQIHFSGCGPNEMLPRIPGLPDDLFTACLTTPLRISLLYHNLQIFPLTVSDSAKVVQRSSSYMAALYDDMSQALKDRLWSELQAILVTIAWQSLEGREYQMLFGQSGDVVSSMAAGFLLSQRVLGSYRVRPESIPPIPSSTSHPLWSHWDLILDNLFEQLPPYFDDTLGETSWEANLKLVSFMADQLESVLTSDQALASEPFRSGCSAGLARLPIICKAAQTTKFRERATTALDTCLQALDIRGLAHAVQGGALDVAGQLLAQQDNTIAPQMISIRASLVRHDACVMSLASEGRTAERLTSVPCVMFFLDALETLLDAGNSESTRTVVQTAAVLSTIANFVAGRAAPRFVARTLRLSSIMLNHEDRLVQQWGGLLIAEVMGSISRSEEDNREVIAGLQGQLLEVLTSGSVESRATAIYALVRWIPAEPVPDIVQLGSSLLLVSRIIHHARADAAAVVRKELVRLFQRVLQGGGVWTSMAFWVYMIQQIMAAHPREKTACEDMVRTVGRSVGVRSEQREKLLQLDTIIKTYDVLRLDPDNRVAELVRSHLRLLTGEFRNHVAKGQWDGIFSALFPDEPGHGEWTTEQTQAVREAGPKLVADWERKKASTGTKGSVTFNNELFEKSKLSLQAYLGSKNDTAADALPEKLAGQPENQRERNWILRHRVLEDSLVVAEQQVGLPWKWQMKALTIPEPCTNIACHSFLNLVLATNRSADLIFWDWHLDTQLGKVHLKLSPNDTIQSARFVNELHDQAIVLAEISNGDIHVLSGSQDDLSHMKTISSFLALDVRRSGMPASNPLQEGTVTSWWRQSGTLCVGGRSDVVKIWDCPAERCFRILHTEEEVPITTLITEPISGNLIVTGYANGKAKIYDIRQARRTSLMTWDGDACISGKVKAGQTILKTGIVLGESTHITSACANGMLNIHDIRSLTRPAASSLIHPSGTSSASFQAHSGLMSTVSTLNPKATGISLDLSALTLDAARPRANWGLHRSTMSRLASVTEETVFFDVQTSDVANGIFRPYTVMHPLRPFLGVGYRNNCWFKGSGIGKGDDTDSGSYSFLRAQAKFVL